MSKIDIVQPFNKESADNVAIHEEFVKTNQEISKFKF